LLGTMALTAAICAREAARWASPAARDPVEDDCVVSFDDRVISLAYADGTTESARLDEIESISIESSYEPFLIWTGPFFVVLHVPDRRLLIPSFDELRADAESPGSAQVSDLAETPDRRTPILGSTVDRATPGSTERRPTETYGRVPGRGQEARAQHGETRAQHSDDSEVWEYRPSESDTTEDRRL
jgi:hypothetical protein